MAILELYCFQPAFNIVFVTVENYITASLANPLGDLWLKLKRHRRARSLRRLCGQKSLAHAMILVSKKLPKKNLVSGIFLSGKSIEYHHCEQL